MKRLTFNIVIAIVLLLVYCTNSTNIKPDSAFTTKYVNTEKATWLLGKWQNISEKGCLQENWEKKNDSTFTGTSFFIIGNDTISSEIINLEERGKVLYYIPTVKNQNDGKPIIFTLTSLSNNYLVFENPSHDFPQKIIYTQITNDSLVAVISGIVNGIEKFQEFPMTRSK